MAEKGFGVKEVNLIGASGTPTITSPNNLNLNAVNVAISTNVSIGGTLSVTGNISIGGTLTYEDVTNIDSVGIVTARDGVVVVGRGVSITAGGLNVTAGVTTFSDDVEFKTGGTTIALLDHSQSRLEFQDNMAISFGNHPDVEIAYSNGNDFSIVGQYNGSGDLVTGFRNSSGNILKSFNAVRSDGSAELYFSNSKKLETNNTGVTITGTATATTFSGSGASLTNIPAANITGTLPAISGANLTGITITPTNSDIQVVYTVTANGASAYRFAGNGVVSTADNPDLYLIRGQKYRFVNNSGGSHPFQIRVASGGAAYSTGVTNNGAASGNIDFAPTFDSPSKLVYQCTSHGGMVGNIYIRGAIGDNDNVGVTTFSGAVNVNATGNSYVLGDFGVGTNSPQSAGLTVENSSEARLRVRAGSNASNGEVALRADGGNTQLGTWSDHDLKLVRNTTEVASLNANGIAFPSGKGIDFSATSDHGSATPASEILDDYEEGSWTPVLESTSTNPTISSYSKQQGLYTKIGNVVYLFCFIDISAGNIGGTLTGDGIITGLPYVISNDPSSSDIHGSACDNLKSIPNTFSSQRNNAMLYFPPGQNYLAIHQYSTVNPIYQTGWGMSQIGNGNRFKWAWTGQYRTGQT